MSISPSTGSGTVLPLQQFAPQSYTPRDNPSPQAGNEYNLLTTVPPPATSPAGSAVTATAASGTTTGIGTPSDGQANAVFRQFPKLGPYLPNLPPAVVPGNVYSAAAPVTPSAVTPATNAAAARQYTAGSGSTASIVSSTMIC